MASNSKPFKAAYVLLASFVTSVFVAVQAMLQISSLLLSLMTWVPKIEGRNTGAAPCIAPQIWSATKVTGTKFEIPESRPTNEWLRALVLSGEVVVFLSNNVSP